MATQCTTSSYSSAIHFPGRLRVDQVLSRAGGKVASAARELQAYLRHRLVLRQNRQAFQTMLGLDEHLLEDIGVIREDVLWANRQPLSVNAAMAMHERAREREARENPARD